jgi:hypothetical protein
MDGDIATVLVGRFFVSGLPSGIDGDIHLAVSIPEFLSVVRLPASPPQDLRITGPVHTLIDRLFAFRHHFSGDLDPASADGMLPSFRNIRSWS